MVNVPIPYDEDIEGFVALNERVCPALIAGVAVLAANDTHSILPSIQYSQAFLDNFAVKPSSSASIVIKSSMVSGFSLPLPIRLLCSILSFILQELCYYRKVVYY